MHEGPHAEKRFISVGKEHDGHDLFHKVMPSPRQRKIRSMATVSTHREIQVEALLCSQRKRLPVHPLDPSVNPDIFHLREQIRRQRVANAKAAQTHHAGFVNFFLLRLCKIIPLLPMRVRSPASHCEATLLVFPQPCTKCNGLVHLGSFCFDSLTPNSQNLPARRIDKTRLFLIPNVL